MPYFRAISTIFFSNLAPSEPVSLKPAVITAAYLTPFFPKSSINDGINLAGIQITAKSTSSSISSILA